MRTLSWAFAGLILLAAPSLIGAEAAAVYVVGSLEEVSPGAEGVLQFDAAHFVFRSGKSEIETPYSKVTQVEIGPIVPRQPDVPFYKVWRLHKKLPQNNPIYRNLTIYYQDEAGGEQAMTFEMLEHDAVESHDAIETGRGKGPAKKASGPWWGDNLWRTNRNAPQWNQQPGNSRDREPAAK